MPGLLKFLTCGSVDDGKSTLIGHMLYDAKLLFTDQEQTLALESKVGSRGGGIDYSLLLDGLMAEREQGITIDVAYRFFTTEHRSFIVADTPGHEEYTRNMAVGASFADLAVILVDAGKGILVQTRRHARICALMGIRHYCFAVNKMDLIDWQEEKFAAIRQDLGKLAEELNLEHVTVIPVSATEGDNVTLPSSHMPWYQGPTLLSFLENADIEEDVSNAEEGEEKLVMPVQRVCRPNASFRGFEGQIEAGSVSVKDRVRVLPSREEAGIEKILVGGKESEHASKGMPVTLVLDREIDVSRGCVIEKNAGLSVADMFTAELLWTDDEPMVQGSSFILKLGTKEIPVSVMKIKYKIDINTGMHVASSALAKNEIAVCDLAASQKITLAPFNKNKALGSFILIDRVTDQTAACGVIRHPLRRSENVIWQDTKITRAMRAERMGQEPKTLWFTGLSGSGKSTIADVLEVRLFEDGRYTMLLDGDNVRKGLNRNLGFKASDRKENIRRIAEVAKLMNDAGLIVLVSFISPYIQDRERARKIIGADNFVEIYVDTPLEICEKRDVKGLYKKARDGKIPNFTGISAPYEAPEHPELTLSTEDTTPEECAEQVMDYLDSVSKK